MPSDVDSNPSLPAIEWGQNASGGRVSVDDPYQLRDLLSRLAIQIDMPGLNGGTPNDVNVGGQINLFMVDPGTTNENGTPHVRRIGDTLLHSHPNSYSMNGELSDPFTLQSESPYLFSRIRDTYQPNLANADNPQVANIFLGLDLTHVRMSFNGLYSPQFSSQNINTSDYSDVIIDLTPQFWSRVGEIISEPSRPSSLQVASGGVVINGGTLDLGRLAESYSAYDDFFDFISSNLSITLSTDVSDQALEFGGQFSGGLNFKHEGSGRTISLRHTPFGYSRGWLLGDSGFGAVDPIFDDNGNPISTQIEFGISNREQFNQLLRFAEEAYEADWSSSISTLGSFDGASKWTLIGGGIQSHDGLAKHNSSINSLFTDLINSESIFFYTKPLSSSLPAQPVTPLRFDIADFQNASVDIFDQSSGFNLEFEGSIPSGFDAVPSYSRYWGDLIFTPTFDASLLGVSHREAGNIVLKLYRELDGLSRDHHSIVREGGSWEVSTLYPGLAEADIPLAYRLTHVNLGFDKFDHDAPNNYLPLSFTIGSDGQVINSHSWGYQVPDSYKTLSQVFPEYMLIKDIAVTGLFDSHAPLSVQLTLLDKPFVSEQSAVGFRYGFRSSSSSHPLTQLAVLGDSVDESQYYYLDIYGTSLLEDFDINALDFTVSLDTSLFNSFWVNDIQIGSALPIANAISVDHDNGLIRFAAASLEDAGAGRSISSGNEELLASVRLNFNEAQLRKLHKNADGSLSASPFSISIAANANETILSKSFVDSDGNINSDIRTLASFGGDVDVDGQDVTLYDAFINLDQLGAGLILGTHRQIGADAGFTNLVRQGDKIHASVDWLNVGNIRAEDLSVAQRYNANGHIIVEESSFTRSGINSGSFIDGVYSPDAREAATLNAVVKVTGTAGNVIDVADGLFSVQARASDQFTNDGKGTSNLITFQGDLNYDGRVSMKDLAYLNAGAARQKTIADVPLGVDADGNGIVDSTVAHDVDADFNGRIDLADLAVLDRDWGRTLHLGDQQFQGSADISWNNLDIQGSEASWDNSSFKEQNAIEASPMYAGSIEGASLSSAIGADGNNSPNDNDMQGAYFQNTL